MVFLQLLWTHLRRDMWHGVAWRKRWLARDVLWTGDQCRGSRKDPPDAGWPICLREATAAAAAASPKRCVKAQWKRRAAQQQRPVLACFVACSTASGQGSVARRLFCGQVTFLVSHLQPDHLLIFWSSLDQSEVLSCFCLVNWWCPFISDQSIQTISKASDRLFYKDYCYLHILLAVYSKGQTICNGNVMWCDAPFEPVNQWIGESVNHCTDWQRNPPRSLFHALLPHKMCHYEIWGISSHPCTKWAFSNFL